MHTRYHVNHRKKGNGFREVVLDYKYRITKDRGLCRGLRVVYFPVINEVLVVCRVPHCNMPLLIRLAMTALLLNPPCSPP